MTHGHDLGRGAFWAGLMSLDITGFGPWMLSQPMVTGPLFGWLMGQVQAGVIIGGMVQLLWMDVSPVGVGIPFDTMSVTILGIYWATMQPECSLPQMMVALILAVPFGYLFSQMDSLARRLNTWGARRLESVPDMYLPWALDLGIVCGLVWSLVRYGFFYALTMWGGQRLLLWAQHFIVPVWVTQGLTYAAYLVPVAGLGVALDLFLTDEPERRYQSSLKYFKSRNS
jgi:mannose/fructose/N-acetylgalactosamine-specific phosphotransferase system component IIC